MKPLQNNFTTPEQSKRLLELGMPADSADMHYHQECVRMGYGKEKFEYFLRYGKPDINKYSTDIPCWSVGRLMEIIAECYQVDMPFRYFIRRDMIESLINTFIELKGEIDFSKLDE